MCVSENYVLVYLLLSKDSAALVTMCLYAVAYLVMFVSDVTQRQEEVGGLCVRAKRQDVLGYKS